MSLIEFIGFVIVMGALSILFGRKAKEERRRRQDPEGYEREQLAKKKALEKMYGILMDGHPPREHLPEESYEEEVVLAAVPPPIPAELRKKNLPERRKPSFPKKEMVILATLYGSPKSCQKLFKH